MTGVNEARRLVTVEVIPYKDFKEKIRIVALYAGKAKVQVYDNYVYVERKGRGGYKS